MKRIWAISIFLVALGVLVKLALKEPLLAKHSRSPQSQASVPEPPVGSTIDQEALALERYSNSSDRAFVQGMLGIYRQTALDIERTDGLRGLRLLESLDLEAIYLYEKHPREFCQLRDALDDRSAAELLLHWREYFSLKRSDDSDREILIGEIARMGPERGKPQPAIPPHCLCFSPTPTA